MAKSSTIPPIDKWRKIFLDTSIIIDFLSDPSFFGKNPLVQERITTAHNILERLIETEPNSEKESREYFISSITIAELKKISAPTVINTIVNLLNAANVTVIGFSKDIAISLNVSLETALEKSEKHQLISYLEKNLKADNVARARQWISDDLKILASAQSIKNLDIVLTSDERTFKPLADNLNITCISITNQAVLQKDLFGKLV